MIPWRADAGSAADRVLFSLRPSPALDALPDGTRVRVNGTSGFVERL
jgi:hypothetical protein